MNTRLFRTLILIVPLLAMIGIGFYRNNASLEVRLIPYELENRSVRMDKFLIARTNTERKRGLQNVENLDGALGLILLYPKPRIAKIWMRNTPLPLYILFVDEAGYVRSAQLGSPNSEDVISADVKTKFVVEIPISKFRGRIDFVGAKFDME